MQAGAAFKSYVLIPAITDVENVAEHVLSSDNVILIWCSAVPTLYDPVVA
jgi:hypothetical protein